MASLVVQMLFDFCTLNTSNCPEFLHVVPAAAASRQLPPTREWHFVFRTRRSHQRLAVAVPFGFVSFLRLAASVFAYLLVVSTILPMVDRATTPVSEPGNS